MQDRTINNALLALRKQIIRGNLDGLGNVETLLVMRGVEVPRVMPAKRKDVARRGQAQRIVLDALKDGPKRMTEIAACMAKARPELTSEAAYQRAGQALAKLKLRGLVKREGRVWLLS